MNENTELRKCHCGISFRCDADSDRCECFSCEQNRDITCRSCGHVGDDVGERYSFGVYAGRLCAKCAMTYRDHCGLDCEQGDPNDLDEEIEPEPSVGWLDQLMEGGLRE